jgi:hypothetical protein
MAGMFLESYSPKLEFCKNRVWVHLIQCCMMIGWTYLVLVIPLIFFAPILERLVTRIPEGKFSYLNPKARFTRAT